MTRLEEMTAKEARKMAESIQRESVLVRRAFRGIEASAEDGMFESVCYVSKFKMEEIDFLIKTLEDKGFEVKLVNTNWFGNRVRYNTKLYIRW